MSTTVHLHHSVLARTSCGCHALFCHSIPAGSASSYFPDQNVYIRNGRLTSIVNAANPDSMATNKNKSPLATRFSSHFCKPYNRRHIVDGLTIWRQTGHVL